MLTTLRPGIIVDNWCYNWY